MNGRKTLAVTFWAMIVVQAIGTVDFNPRGDGQRVRKLPAPRNFVAAVVLWSLLGLFAELGPGQARVAGRLSSLVVVTAVFVGLHSPGTPSGTPGERLIGFFEAVSRAFAPPGEGGGSSGAGVDDAPYPPPMEA
jgi:hypothetical protein